MKTEIEKMHSSEMYYFSDPEIKASLNHANRVCAWLRGMSMLDEDYRNTLKELIPDIPDSSSICRRSITTTARTSSWRKMCSSTATAPCSMPGISTSESIRSLNQTACSIPPSTRWTTWNAGKKKKRPIPSSSARTAGWEEE